MENMKTFEVTLGDSFFGGFTCLKALECVSDLCVCVRERTRELSIET